MRNVKSGLSKIAVLTAASLLLGACFDSDTVTRGEKLSAPTLEEAKAFIAEAEKTLHEEGLDYGRALWVQANFVTTDTNKLAASADEKFTLLTVDLATKAKRFNDVDMPADLRRKFNKLKFLLDLPAPQNKERTAELATIKANLGATYATGKLTLDGKEATLGDASDVLATERDPAKLLEAWDGWRKISFPMKDQYARMVEIANEGAVEMGFDDIGGMWRGQYEMEDFAGEADRLWGQVKPLYDALHCHVRAKLNENYGDEVVSKTEAIPAHLLGNMWAQSWGNIYDMVKPDGEVKTFDLTERLVANDYDARKMAGAADDFFQSLGFDPLPDTFWERSLFVKPRDREVQCHASAWNLDAKDDIRIKMCTKVNGEDFATMHHEVGHNIYQRAYKHQSGLDQGGAHGGFHEAIGDMIALSITPEYLKTIGLIDEVPSADADIPLLMKQALEKVAFLPFGLMVDQWRWKVFSGEVTPANYNDAWWGLREKYQGVKAPNERPAEAFDPGAKFHIPNNTSYTRYFLAHILQFQFHQTACEDAGWEGPLHRCSIYGNKDVGAKFKAMQELGSSKPWPDALEVFTGTREMNGSSVVAYFAPLKEWLDEQNKNRSCGW